MSAKIPIARGKAWRYHGGQDLEPACCQCKSPIVRLFSWVGVAVGQIRSYCLRR
jgi:hypothetical protein